MTLEEVIEAHDTYGLGLWSSPLVTFMLTIVVTVGVIVAITIIGQHIDNKHGVPLFLKNIASTVFVLLLAFAFISGLFTSINNAEKRTDNLRQWSTEYVYEYLKETPSERKDKVDVVQDVDKSEGYTVQYSEDGIAKKPQGVKVFLYDLPPETAPYIEIFEVQEDIADAYYKGDTINFVHLPSNLTP